MSPHTLQLRNIKPFMFLFTTTSCQDCRDMLDSLAHEEDPAFLSNLSAQFNAVLVLDDYTLEFGVSGEPVTAKEHAESGKLSNLSCVPSMLAAFSVSLLCLCRVMLSVLQARVTSAIALLPHLSQSRLNHV